MPANRGLSNHCWVAAISFSNDLMSGLLGSGGKVEVLGDPRSVPLEGLDVAWMRALAMARSWLLRLRFKRSMYQGGFDAHW